jgi:hypothetical protein
MEPSNFIRSAVKQLIDKHRNDALNLCIDMEKQLIKGIAEELLFNEDLTFSDRFQLIEDICYCSKVLESLINNIQKAVDDPYYYHLVGVFGEE